MSTVIEESPELTSEEHQQTLPPLVEVCPECGGVGMIYRPVMAVGDDVPEAMDEMPCETCDGTGKALTPAGEQVAELMCCMMRRIHRRGAKAVCGPMGFGQ